MTVISEDFQGQTVITTFEMTPGTCADLLDELKAAYADFIRHQPGFLSAGLHVNDAQTRIANYSKWQRREDFMAMLRTPGNAPAQPQDRGSVQPVRTGDV